MNNTKVKIKITPRFKRDKKLTSLMETFLNAQWKIYEDVIYSIARTRGYLFTVYGITTPDSIWEDILKSVVDLHLKQLEKDYGKPKKE